ncbi:type I-C CRISPR-associated protein Cas8c/Csd1 [Paenibacillus sp. 598K]|uniref:type I-C CRISPR-associated protein Cas8c/Csd1 n=1 Tax=Paenibacillus sp. 598K TaxID=1117987 RepID=UPI000FFA3A11|nr:type I-C CRISPR-associated protein Cas8c/Csd1 [Paenibacillus sp. 598K]GBF73620.1 type I-C CRISPR-associated protein Cas8c/Csd1 [Paenibacillus sp. 598K]
MILQALHAYYQLLQEQDDGDLPKQGYSAADVSFELHLDAEGRLVDIIPYTNEKGKSRKETYNVPEQEKRTVKITPYFLCDKAEYLFGTALGMRAACRESMQVLWRSVMAQVEGEQVSVSPEWKAITAFVEATPEQLAEQLDGLLSEETKATLATGGLCVLKYAPTGRFLHDHRLLQSAWEKYRSGGQSAVGAVGDTTQICLVSGDRVPTSDIARLHPNIKNVIGAQSSGAAIVSFNKDSFESFGRKQSFNAPTSKNAADAYGYVLNRLLADPKHRVRMNDMTVVFWAESAVDHEQLFLASLMQEERSDETLEEGPPDPESVRERVKSAVSRVRNGQEFRDTFSDLDPETTFYVLGISPNAARLSMRFFYRGTLGEIGERVWQHYKDLAIVGLDRTPTIRQLLKELAVGHDWSNIPPNMEGQLFRSIMQELPYSKAIFAQLINRIRADQDDPRKGLYKIGSVRAAMLKAYLLRAGRNGNHGIREGELTVAENMESTNVAYNLGRLFACLEKTQKDALGAGINATIRDRFWGAASAAPASVFPRLLHLAQHHVSKDEKRGFYNNELIGKVMVALPERLPRRLTLEEQGMFAIGYYHKRQGFYAGAAKSSGDAVAVMDGAEEAAAATTE